MKKSLLTIVLAAGLLTSANAQQQIGFLAGLPNQTISPVFTLPANSGFAGGFVTLMTGPSMAEADSLKSLSGSDLLNSLASLRDSSALSVFRTGSFTSGANVLMGGQIESFAQGGQQIWVMASTSPLDSLSTSDYVALFADAAWKTAGPTDPIKPDFTMNTSVLDASELYIGNFGSIELEAIPEPSTYAAIFGGLALAGAFIRRRFKK